MTRFIDLFDGRHDAVGGEDGLCIKCEGTNAGPYLADPDGWFRWRVQTHLDSGGAYAMGVYPLRADLTARWGCIDIDVNDQALTQAVYEELWKLGVVPYVEFSRSKGYHVWWFYPQFIPGWIPRVIGLDVCNTLDVELEVNPKQFWLKEEQVGNYVRLPYPAGSPLLRRMFVVEGMMLDRDEFLDQVQFSHPEASRQSALSSVLCPVEYLLGVKFPQFVGGAPAYSGGGNRTPDAARQEAFNVAFRGAPVPAGQRDNQLFTVANVLWACGLTQPEALNRMHDVWKQVEQVSGNEYPVLDALGKVYAVYRSRGEPTRRPDVSAPIAMPKLVI